MEFNIQELPITPCQDLLAYRYCFDPESEEIDMEDIEEGPSFIERLSEGTQRRWNDFNTTLRRLNQEETHVVVAGGVVLNAYNSSYQSSDMDMYVHQRHAEEVLKMMIANSYVCKSLLFAPAYDQSFFRKNNIMNRISLKKRHEIDRHRAFVDIMVIPDSHPIIDVVSHFDLTFCQVWYDGFRVQATHRQDILSKRGSLQEDYLEALLVHFNNFIIKRIDKYTKRGYHVSYQPIQRLLTYQPAVKHASDREEWVVKFLYKLFIDCVDREGDALIMYDENYGREYNVRKILATLRFPVYPYTIQQLTSAIIQSELSTESFLGSVRNVYHEMLMTSKYYIEGMRYGEISQYINDINQMLGISSEEYNEIVKTFHIRRKGKELRMNLRRDPNDVMSDPFDEEIVSRALRYSPEPSRLREHEDAINGVCLDVPLERRADIAQQLDNNDSYLFVTASGILCMRYEYIRSLYLDKGKWIYECDYEYVRERHDEEGQNVDFYNFPGNLEAPYIKIVVNKEGGYGAIPVYQILYIIKQRENESLRRVYHIVQKIHRSGRPSMLTNTTQRSSFDVGYNYGDRYGELSYQSSQTPHCQAHTGMDVYEIKICGDHCSLTNQFMERRNVPIEFPHGPVGPSDSDRPNSQSEHSENESEDGSEEDSEDGSDEDSEDGSEDGSDEDSEDGSEDDSDEDSDYNSGDSSEDSEDDNESVNSQATVYNQVPVEAIEFNQGEVLPHRRRSSLEDELDDDSGYLRPNRQAINSILSSPVLLGNSDSSDNSSDESDYGHMG